MIAKIFPSEELYRYALVHHNKVFDLNDTGNCFACQCIYVVTGRKHGMNGFSYFTTCFNNATPNYAQVPDQFANWCRKKNDELFAESDTASDHIPVTGQEVAEAMEEWLPWSTIQSVRESLGLPLKDSKSLDQHECEICGVICLTRDMVKVKCVDDTSIGSLLVCSTCEEQQ